MDYFMYSNIDFLIIFFIALLFVGMFKIQRKYFARKYYELSRRIFGRGITLRMMLIRLIMIFGLSYLAYWLTNDKEVVVLGILLGSFLIVWPVLLNPSTFDVNEITNHGNNVVHISRKGWIFLFISYASFILSAVTIAYLSASFGEYIIDQTIKSFKSWLSSAWWLILLFILTSKNSEWFENLLEKDIFKNEERLNQYDNTDE